MIGAGIGALAGYLLFTERGRVLRRQFEATLEAVAPEVVQFGATVNRAAVMASEGWRLMNDAFRDGARSPRYVAPTQTRPF
jgi:hypothetical protein